MKTTKQIVAEQTAFAKANGIPSDQTNAAVDGEEGGDDTPPDGEDDGDIESIDLPHSVVKGEYKVRYAQRAVAMARKPKDVPLKALKRSNSDWLAIELAKRTLDAKAKLVVPSLEAILDANGVKHSHWNRTTKGWQGRLRMTGRLALQRVVAEAGELVLPDGATIAAPRVWVAKHAN